MDLSLEPLTSMTDAALGVFSHHKTATIWFGYLEGWMLDPMEETRLRPVIRELDCHVITREPISFSQAWKNEIDWVYTVGEDNGSPDSHNNGRFVHNGSSS